MSTIDKGSFKQGGVATGGHSILEDMLLAGNTQQHFQVLTPSSNLAMAAQV